MRWLIVVAAAGGCSFAGSANSSRDASPAPGHDGAPGAPGMDAPMPIDMPRDAPAAMRTCTTTYQLVATHLYKRTANASWQDAETECEADGAHLVTVDDLTENTLITTTFIDAQHTYTWIGLHDPPPDDDVYVWTDGTAPYKQPTGSGQSPADCVDMGSNGAWEAYTCSYAGHAGVCECD